MTTSLSRRRFSAAIALGDMPPDVMLSLLSADGSLIVKADNSNGTRGAEVASLVAGGGDEAFRVKVEAREPRAKPAHYAVRIAELRAATAEDAGRVAQASVQVISSSKVAVFMSPVVPTRRSWSSPGGSP